MDGIKQALRRYLEALASDDKSQRTVDEYKSKIRQFEEWRVKKGEAGTPDRGMLTRFRDTLREGEPGIGQQPVVAGTIRIFFTAIWSWFEWQEREGLAEGLPKRGSVKLPRRAPPQRRVISHGEMARIWEATEKMPAHRFRLAMERAKARALLVVLCHMLRRSEILALQVEDVMRRLIDDGPRWCLRVRSGKGREPRFVPLSDEGHRLLLEYLEQRAVWAEERGDVTSALFVTNRTTPMGNNGFDALLSDILARAGLEGSGVTAHCFRHFGASALNEEQGVNLATISALLGHSRIDTTYNYLKATEESKLFAVQRLPIPERPGAVEIQRPPRPSQRTRRLPLPRQRR